MKNYFLLLFLFCTACTNSKLAQTNTFVPSKTTIASKTAGMKQLEGYFNLFWEASTGKIWLEVDQWDTEFLYVNSLAAGVGSNDIGLDRGQLGNEQIVKFVKSGPKVLLVQPNYKYRAVSDNPQERRSVEEAFAQSILWGFKASVSEGGSTLVDATAFLLRDAHDVATKLKNKKQGTYQLDQSRSAVYLPMCKSFPKNTEMEATLTFTGIPKGEYVYQVVPNAKAISVRQHHSFIELPDDQYEPRVLDPRCGFFGISYQDYATPIDEPLVKQFINRHRLEKKNPNAEKSEAVEPIIYYLDPGAPEPIRSALLDGARWWNQAFEAAGYIDAFQVKILPEGADPMDVRYNLVQWVHRATRGWSYGSSVSDPRTGEIIKGHVSLGSLRVRQDFLIAQGILAPYEEGKTVSDEMKEMALARLRQLSAHEIGHTIGLAHNFAASTNDRASVMDYPHPFIQVAADGSFDFSDAYDDKIGEWDKRTVLYGYQDFPEGTNEAAALKDILTENNRLGFRYMSDADARPMGGAHPYAHLWDNGEDAVQEFYRMLDVRAKALERFDANAIPMHTPMSSLEEVLVPLYLSHRYQLEAVAKLVGGLHYTYAVRGEASTNTYPVDFERQKAALSALTKSLEPEVLKIPPSILQLIPPKAFSYNRGRESFKARTGLTMDPITAAESSVHQTLSLLLHPQRAARLVQQEAATRTFGLNEVIQELVKATFEKTYIDMDAELNRMVQQQVVQHLLALATNGNAPEQVRAIAQFELFRLEQQLLAKRATGKAKVQAHRQYLLSKITHFRTHPSELMHTPALDLPDGSPIGMEYGCGHPH